MTDFLIVSPTVSDVATSPTGVTWTSGTLPAGAWRIGANSSIYVAVEYNVNPTRTYYSSDGLSWTANSTIAAFGQWTPPVWTGTYFISIGSNSQQLIYSTDGISWSYLPTAVTSGSSGIWSKPAWDGTVWCTVSSTGLKCATSPDGITWTFHNMYGTIQMGTVASDGAGQLVAINSGTTQYTEVSTNNGVTWSSYSAHPLPSSSSWGEIVYGGGTYVVIASRLATANTICAISSNGTTWSAITLPVAIKTGKLGWNGSLFLLTGIDTSVSPNVTLGFTSPNGSTWTQQTLPTLASGDLFDQVTAKLGGGAAAYSIIGSSSIEVIPASVGSSIVGSSDIAILPSSTFRLNTHNIIAGSSAVSVVPGSTLDYNKNDTVSEVLTIAHTTFSKQIVMVFESIIALLSVSAPTTSRITVHEYLSVLDSLASVLRLVIAESLICSSTFSGIILQIESIIESIPFLDTASASYHALSTILETVLLIDSIKFGLKFTVVESMVLQDTLSALFKTINTILESLVITDSHSSTYIHILSIAESLTLDPQVLQASVFNNSLLDSFIISIPSAAGQDTYLAYVLNTETNSVSNYTNYNFTSSTSFNGKFLFGNASGIYEYGDTSDDGTLIESKFKTIAYSFGTSNLKQIPEMYIGGTLSDAMVLKVKVDNRADVYYRINNHIDNLHTQRIKFGKGLIGKYFQFELITSAINSDIESIEFYPIILKRKI